ncbi:MAG: hypothetical protein Q7R50_01550 [Dehalococcoidales bacterium]|nr:hypothetical protein [Dehalococcoidales bacterium]
MNSINDQRNTLIDTMNGMVGQLNSQLEKYNVFVLGKTDANRRLLEFYNILSYRKEQPPQLIHKIMRPVLIVLVPTNSLDFALF